MARREKMNIELGDLVRQKGLASGQDKNRVHGKTRNGAWLRAVPHRRNGTELSREEFRDNLCLRYGLMPQDFPVTCDGCGKRFFIEHAISCPKVGLVLARHYDAAKEWGALGVRALVPSAKTYKPIINSRTVQWERTGAGAWQDGGGTEGGTDTVGES